MTASRRAACGVLALAAGGLSACGSGGKGATTSKTTEGPDKVSVYSSLPLAGPAAPRGLEISRGIRLALSEAHDRAGDVQVTYHENNDAPDGDGGWDPTAAAKNARKAAQDTDSVAYIGDVSSGATEVALPILNTVGLAQISPGAGYVGLTTGEPGAANGEPQKYRLSGNKTFVRLTPRDSVQAAALLDQMRGQRCATLGIVDDGDVDGTGLAKQVALKAKSAMVATDVQVSLDRDAPDVGAAVDQLRAERPDCVLYAGQPGGPARQVLEQAATSLPDVRLFGSAALCAAPFTDPRHGGLSTRAGRRFTCVTPVTDVSATAPGRAFVAAYRKAYDGERPDENAAVGFEAMQLTLATIRGGATSRGAFVSKLLATRDRESVLGTYSFDSSGDITLGDYGVFRVGRSGQPQLRGVVKSRDGA